MKRQSTLYDTSHIKPKTLELNTGARPHEIWIADGNEKSKKLDDNILLFDHASASRYTRQITPL